MKIAFSVSNEVFIYTIIKHKLELKKKSESWAIDTSAGVIFFDNSALNK